MITHINGTAIPKPFTTLGSTVSQLVVNSNRTVGQGGKLYKELIGTKISFPVTWSRLTLAQYNTIYNLLYGKNFITVTYYDNHVQGFTTAEFYHSDITFSNIRCNETTKVPQYYYDVSIEIIMR